jgi:hypothetical protein
MKNRYAGNCYGCGDFVAAGQGIYESGEVFCSEPTSLEDVPESLRQRFRLTVKRWATCWNRVNPILGTDFATLQELRDQQRAEYEASRPTAEQIAANKERARLAMAEDRKQRRAELAEFKARDICPRCHGAGGSDAWHATGWTCARCHGSGKY